MIYIPKKIKVGYQNRSDTYSGKLAYIIYYDEKGKLRKEASWQNWRSKDIEPEEFDNEPVSGFVLNKKVGGYAYYYDVRQTYVRVYDPRGFEFEITIPNLIFILENTSSIKGKGLEGEFVYGWDGKELVLIPTSSPDYIELMDHAERVQQGCYYIDPSEIRVGYQYKTKKDRIWTYMGRFDYYDWSGEKKGKRHFFCWKIPDYRNASYFISIETLASLKGKLSAYGDSPDEQYAECFEKLECSQHYSPIDEEVEKYKPLTLKEFSEHIPNGWYRWMTFIASSPLVHNEEVNLTPDGSSVKYVIYRENGYSYLTKWREIQFETTSIEELYNYLKPVKKQTFLKNGKLFREEYRI